MSKWLSVAGFVVVFDQLSKWVVTQNLVLGERVDLLPIFSWVRWHNDGAAFSILSGGSGWQLWFFVILAIGFAGFILYELRRLPVGHWVMGLAYGLIMGGALGNMIDRITTGYVVDFVLVHYGDYYFPAFNVADSSLTIGAAVWIGCMIQEARASRANA